MNLSPGIVPSDIPRPAPPDRPVGWRLRESKLDGFCTEGRALRRELRVICSDGNNYGDGRWWRHVSVSARQAPLPTWEELEWVRKHFIGDRYAYQVHVPAADHVNIREVLHLWALMDDGDGRITPDFTMGSGSI